MPTATNRTSIIDALLRLHRHSKRKPSAGKASLAAQREAAARYRAVLNAPTSKETRDRAEYEVRSGSRPVVHLGRVR